MNALRHRLLIAGLALGLPALAAPAAHADTLLTPSKGAVNLTRGGGWHAWAAPQDGGGYRLVLRTPGGEVVVPQIPAFGAAPDPSIGSDRFAAGRRLLVAYSRCSGASTTRGCDVWALDTTTLREAKVAALSSRTYSETAPSVQYGRWAFVRRGKGRSTGVHSWSAGNRVRRITGTLARETATNATRVAYTYNSRRGGGVAVRRVSGQGGAILAASRLPVVPTDVNLTRYQAAWLVPGQGAFVTERFAGSGGENARPAVKPASRQLPAGTVSLALGASSTDADVLTADGLVRPSPPLFIP